MQYQVHNWYHFAWLSGDNLAEQHVHNLDIANWVMSAYLKKEGDQWAHPVEANGMGASLTRGYNGKNVQGEIFDAHFVEFTYENGIKLYSQCRHQPNTWGGVFECFHSTTSPDGKPNLAGRGVSGAAPGPKLAMGAYQQEHLDLQTAIKDDKPLNEGWYGAASSFTAVLGRYATTSGQNLKWDEAAELGPDQFPQNLTWETPTPTKPDANGFYQIPVPGQYKPYTVPKGWKPTWSWKPKK
jgi:predicted dehydrogenase